MSLQEQESGAAYLRALFPDAQGDDLQSLVKSGVILCKLANKVSPGEISKIDERNIPFVFCANIVLFN